MLRPFNVTVKLRLLFSSALFLFVQIATMHAQETLDVAKWARHVARDPNRRPFRLTTSSSVSAHPAAMLAETLRSHPRARSVSAHESAC
jgi:hypothetical protein